MFFNVCHQRPVTYSNWVLLWHVTIFCAIKCAWHMQISMPPMSFRAWWRPYCICVLHLVLILLIYFNQSDLPEHMLFSLDIIIQCTSVSVTWYSVISGFFEVLLSFLIFCHILWLPLSVSGGLVIACLEVGALPILAFL